METASIHSCKQDLELVEVQRYVSKKEENELRKRMEAGLCFDRFRFSSWHALRYPPMQ
jgi:hypothetical protein